MKYFIFYHKLNAHAIFFPLPCGLSGCLLLPSYHNKISYPGHAAIVSYIDQESSSVSPHILSNTIVYVADTRLAHLSAMQALSSYSGEFPQDFPVLETHQRLPTAFGIKTESPAGPAHPNLCVLGYPWVLSPQSPQLMPCGSFSGTGINQRPLQACSVCIESTPTLHLPRPCPELNTDTASRSSWDIPKEAQTLSAVLPFTGVAGHETAQFVTLWMRLC